jgi:ribosomal subunit interface protein
MNLTIRSHHTTLDDGLREHAEKKLARIERLLPRVDDVIVEVEHEETRAAAHRYAVQVTVHSGGSILRGEERAADPKIALDLATEVVSRQARRHGKRLHARHRTGQNKEAVAASVMPPVAPEPDERAPEDAAEYILGKVVRVKEFEAKPMSEEEALAQMDLLGHDFFLFLDVRTKEFAVLYKRRDGDYGLLTPQRGPQRG